MGRHIAGLAALGAAASIAAVWAVPSRAAEPVMVQCGREYQAAKSAGTLNGLDWNAYRIACSERLKASASTAAPVAAVSAAPAAAVAPPVPARTAAPAAAPAAPSAAAPAPIVQPAAVSGPVAAPAGLSAVHARQKQCGAEWTANKVALVAATPGLTWPRYWSQCNTRLKAAAGGTPAGR